MQLRPSNSCHDFGEHRVHVGTLHHPKLTGRRKWEDEVDGPVLPISDPRDHLGKKNCSKWIHVIPLIVLLCLFILWWFSYPVTLRSTETRLISLRQMDLLLPANFSRVDHSMLAVANSPFPSALENPSSNYGYEVQFMSTID